MPEPRGRAPHRAYSVAAATAFTAAALNTDPLAVLTLPDEDGSDQWDLHRLATPVETGIHVVGAEAVGSTSPPLGCLCPSVAPSLSDAPGTLA